MWMRGEIEVKTFELMDNERSVTPDDKLTKV